MAQDLVRNAQKPFRKMCFPKPKVYFLATTKEGLLWRKKGETFVEKNTLLTVKHAAGSIMRWGAGGTGNIIWMEGRIDSTIY